MRVTTSITTDDLAAIPAVSAACEAAGFDANGATGAADEETDRAFEFIRKRVGFYGSRPWRSTRARRP